MAPNIWFHHQSCRIGNRKAIFKPSLIIFVGRAPLQFIKQERVGGPLYMYSYMDFTLVKQVFQYAKWSTQERKQIFSGKYMTSNLNKSLLIF